MDLDILDLLKRRVGKLSAGQKTRVSLAKSLINDPKILFLDEPTASVDVELRKDMWKVVNKLKNKGVTIILTTHYIEEAEVIADRVGIINHGELILVENKNDLIKKMGQKKLIIDLKSTIKSIPTDFKEFNLILSEDKKQIFYS